MLEIVPGARVLSDGLGCFNGLDEAGLMHTKIVTGGGRPKAPEFLWVNITLGNVKSAVTGTCRSLDERHVPRYLAAYEWRYNRRFDLPKNLERLARVEPHRHHGAQRFAEMRTQIQIPQAERLRGRGHAR